MEQWSKVVNTGFSSSVLGNQIPINIDQTLQLELSEDCTWEFMKALVSSTELLLNKHYIIIIIIIIIILTLLQKEYSQRLKFYINEVFSIWTAGCFCVCFLVFPIISHWHCSVVSYILRSTKCLTWIISFESNQNLWDRYYHISQMEKLKFRKIKRLGKYHTFIKWL